MNYELAQNTNNAVVTIVDILSLFTEFGSASKAYDIFSA